MENLFSYGTLQFKKVQKETFGRILNGKKDILRGYKLKKLIIKDKNVINSSGINTHPIIYYTGENKDFVDGILFKVTELEINNADSYEVNEYKRVKVKFESGNNGWVYIEK